MKVWLLTTALFLGACSAPMRETIHTLRPAAATPPLQVSWRTDITAVSVPGALDRAQWVVRRGAELQVLEQQRWPQPLGTEIAEALADHLNQAGLLAFVKLGASNARLQLQLDVLRFDTYSDRGGVDDQFHWSLRCGGSGNTGGNAQEQRGQLTPVVTQHTQAIAQLGQAIATAAKALEPQCKVQP